jgi:hypothetical protein
MTTKHRKGRTREPSPLQSSDLITDVALWLAVIAVGWMLATGLVVVVSVAYMHLT